MVGILSLAGSAVLCWHSLSVLARAEEAGAKAAASIDEIKTWVRRLELALARFRGD